jgi:hypothetical protein
MYAASGAKNVPTHGIPEAITAAHFASSLVLLGRRTLGGPVARAHDAADIGPHGTGRGSTGERAAGGGDGSARGPHERPQDRAEQGPEPKAEHRTCEVAQERVPGRAPGRPVALVGGDVGHDLSVEGDPRVIEGRECDIDPRASGAPPR